jgi:MerR family transcriptional regulator, light-induced transcriptional regulator
METMEDTHPLDDDNDALDKDEPGYRIGAVTRLTGIQPDTLRMWERRYQVVRPRRTATANRLYSHHDLARLSLIKQLVDGGHAIGTIANLSLEQLQARVGYQPRGAAVEAHGTSAPRVAVLGDSLHAQFAVAPPRNEGLEWVLSGRDREAFAAAARAAGADVIVMEVPSVQADSYALVQRTLAGSGARHVIVVYGFGTRRLLRQLAAANCTILRGPAGPEDLRLACLRAAGQQATALADGLDAAHFGSPAPRRFAPDSLARAANQSSTVECECPQHLADIIQSLNAFEDYSATCTNRNEADAALHTMLHNITTQARAMMEKGLEHVLRAEGIDVSVEGTAGDTPA